jgi:hypothetical protein
LINKKIKMKNTAKFSMLFAGALLLLLGSCVEDEPAMVLPPSSESATFSYSFDPDNANRVIFTGQPDVATWYTHWSFGDNTSAEGQEVSKLYFLKGDYEVRFKIFTEGGTAETTQMISIASDILGPNLLENGELDGGTSWNVLPISNGVDVTFENGAAVWRGGGFGQVGIYQSIEVEANTTYQINMDISGGGMTDCWFEVYIGTSVPVDGVDYNDGGIRMGLNTWDGCGSTPFDGQLSTLTCVGSGSTFEFPNAVTAYLVIRGGGADYGTGGVTVDNIAIRKL